MKEKKEKRNIRIAVLLLLVFIVLFLLVWFRLRPAAAILGEKTIHVSVLHGDGSERSFTFETDAVTLRPPLEDAGLIGGEEGPFGLYVLTVDGETVDEDQQQWWYISKNGEMLSEGVETTMLADGESYEFTFKEGW